MNENHNSDKERLAKIDKIVFGNTKTNDETLSALVNTKPIAEEAFQDNLEEQLIARLTNTQNQEEPTMNLFSPNEKRKNRRGSRLPITLAAAVIAIALIGGLILFMPHANTDTVSSVAQNSTAQNNLSLVTATAEEIAFTQVVIAIQDIPTGTRITAEMVTALRFPVQSTPVGSFENVDDVIGQYARSDIYREEIILEQELAIDDANIVNNVSDSATTENPFELAPTLTLREATATPIAENEVPLRMIIAYRDIELGEVITDEMVTVVEYMDEGWPLAEDVDNPETIFWSSEAVVIGQQASAYIRQFEPLTDQNIARDNGCREDCVTLPLGRVAIAINTNDATPLVMPRGMYVDVVAALQFIDATDGDHQLIVDEDDLPLDVVPQIRINRVGTNAMLLDVHSDGEGIMVWLAVTPQDAEVLTFMSEANAPLQIMPHVDESELLFENQNIVAIPISEIESSIQRGDIIDIEATYEDDGSTQVITISDVVVISVGVEAFENNRIVPLGADETYTFVSASIEDNATLTHLLELDTDVTFTIRLLQE